MIKNVSNELHNNELKFSIENYKINCKIIKK